MQTQRVPNVPAVHLIVMLHSNKMGTEISQSIKPKPSQSQPASQPGIQRASQPVKQPNYTNRQTTNNRTNKRPKGANNLASRANDHPAADKHTLRAHEHKNFKMHKKCFKIQKELTTGPQLATHVHIHTH